MTNKLNMSNCCAICLAESKLLYYPIEKYLDKVFFATNLEINLINDIITKICSDCLKSLQNAIEFKELFCKTQKTLSEYIKKEYSSIDADNCFYDNVEIEFVDLSGIKNESEIEQKSAPIEPSEPVIYKNEELLLNNEEEEEDSMHAFDFELTDNISEEEFEINFEQLTPQIPIPVDEIQINPKKKQKKNPKQINEATNTKTNTEIVKKKRKKYPTKKLALQCDLCGKVFVAKHKYDLHIKAIHKGIQEICKICQKGYLSSSQLSRHMAIHLNEKKYKCTVENCDRGFNDISSLRIHVKIHSDDRNYVCTICSMSFKYPTSLRSHYYSHSNVRKLECEVCGQGFNQPHKMREHKLIHTGEKPHKCPYCDMMFRSKRQIKPHVTKYHKLESK